MPEGVPPEAARRRDPAPRRRFHGMLSLSLRLGGVVGLAFALAALVAGPPSSSWLDAAGPVSAGAWLGVLSGAALWLALKAFRWSQPVTSTAPSASAALIVLWALPAAAIAWQRSGPDWAARGTARAAAVIGGALLFVLVWRALDAALARVRAPLSVVSFLLAFLVASWLHGCAGLPPRGVARGWLALGVGVLTALGVWLASELTTRSHAWRAGREVMLRRTRRVAWGVLGAGTLAAWSLTPAAPKEPAASRPANRPGRSAGLVTNANLGDQALVTLGSEVRAVVPAPCPVDLAYPVEGARAVELSWGLAGSMAAATAQFRAVVRADDGGKHVLLDETVVSPGENRPVWFSRVVALPPGAAHGEIVLRTRGTSRDSFWAPPVPAGGPTRAPSRRNVIIVSLDTVGAGHLNSYGYKKRRTSPEIDAWADEGTLFENAASTSPGTLSSQMSILTGLYPSSHGVSYANWRSTGSLPVLPRNVLTLAETVRSHGFLTAAFTGFGYFALPLGYSRGFQEFVATSDETRGSAASVFEKAFHWLEGHREDPFLMFLHTYEAHAPYLDQRFVFAEGLGPQDQDARNEAMYDGDLARADAYVGALRRKIQALGLADHTLVLIVADHGEEFGGHFGLWDDGHGHSLFQEVTHVPFVAVGPTVRRGRRLRPALDLTAVAPTVLEFLGIDPPQAMAGRRLMGVLSGEKPSREPEWLAFSEDVWIGPEMRAVRSDRWKLIEKGGDLPERFLDEDAVTPEEIARRDQRRAIHRKARAQDPLMLFDLERDPGETRNVVSAEKSVAGRYHRSLASQLQPGPHEASSAEVQVEGEALERLRALGYVQ